MYKRKVDHILAQCLADIEAGRLTAAECLERYPEYREALEPLLALSGEVRALPPVSPTPAFRRSAKQRLRARLEPRRRRAVTIPGWPRWKGRSVATAKQATLRRPAMSWLLIITLIISILTGGGVVTASAEALPGDALYPVKVSLEAAQLMLTFDQGNEVQLRLQFAERRLGEMRALVEQGRYDEIPQALAGFGTQVTEALRGWLRAVEAGEGTEAMAEGLELAFSRHDEVLNELLGQVPEQAQPAIQHAIEVSQTGDAIVRQVMEGTMPAPTPDAVPTWAPRGPQGPEVVPPQGTQPMTPSLPMEAPGGQGPGDDHGSTPEAGTDMPPTEAPEATQPHPSPTGMLPTVTPGMGRAPTWTPPAR